jgi:hypothetical protein
VEYGKVAGENSCGETHKSCQQAEFDSQTHGNLRDLTLLLLSGSAPAPQLPPLHIGHWEG